MCLYLEKLTAIELSSIGSCDATCFSAIATIGLLYMAYKTHIYVKKEDETQYARKVAVWINGQNFGDGHFIEATIINLSECPIYDVYVVGEQYEKKWFKKSKLYSAYSYREVIAPNLNEANKVFMTVKVLGTPKNLASVTASMFFRDINGTEWCRDSHGRLCKSPGYLKFFGKGSNKS